MLRGAVLVVASLTLLCAPSGLLAQPAQSPPPSPNASSKEAPKTEDIDALRQLETEYLRAEAENSPALARKVLADDFLGIKSDGGSTTKADVLKALAAREGHPASFNISEINMREYLFGDTACVTYTKIYTVPGRQQAYSEDLLHVFTKRNGVWQLQVSSPIPTPKPLASR